ncbi:transposable element Tcb1 transposase [Trichonephila clavipes]|nr:transposable element Tcb1 transposase [Trichonephila clavipes]
MSSRKQLSALDQEPEFDTERIVAYRNCGLSFRDIGRRVGRNETTVIRICDRWMQEESRICLKHPDGWIRVWRYRGETMLNSCVMHHHTGSAPHIKVWGGIGYHSRTPLVRNAGTLNSQRYISDLLEPVVFPYIQGLATAILQQDNGRPHVARIVQRFFVNHQI